MIHLLGFFLALAIAVTTGFGATWLAMQAGHGFEKVTIGDWSIWPKAGTPEADPYARAVIARTGEVPLSLGEGLLLQGEHDDLGRPLVGGCTYSVRGELPPAREWTLTAYDPAGRIADNPARRFSFTSSEVIRDAEGNFEIILSPDVSPGNWLPIPRTDIHLLLLLRLYDTQLNSSVGQIGKRLVPRVERKTCL